MSDLRTFDTTGRCLACAGVVSNIEGRRLTREQLAEIHNETCPGRHRRRAQ